MPNFKNEDAVTVADRTSDLDRIASMILTLLYSLEHVEYGYSNLQRANDMIRQIEQAAGGRATLVASWKKIVQKATSKALFDEVVRLVEAGPLSAADRTRLAAAIAIPDVLNKFTPAQLDEIRWTGETMPRDSSINPLTGETRVRIATRARDDPSEISFDTAAVCPWDGHLLVALNYKNRVTGASGLPASEALSAAARQLMDLIDDDGGERYTSITFVNPTLASIDRTLAGSKVTVPASKMRDDSADSKRAAPHAEMQLVKYLTLAATGSARPIVFGVSKPPCELCSTVLEAEDISFTAWDDALASDRVLNWLGPELIPLTGVIVVSRSA